MRPLHHLDNVPLARWSFEGAAEWHGEPGNSEEVEAPCSRPGSVHDSSKVQAWPSLSSSAESQAESRAGAELQLPAVPRPHLRAR